MSKKIIKKKSQNLKGKDILSLDQLSTEDVKEILYTAKKLKPLRVLAKPSSMLSGKIISLVFYEPSTRTFSSFASAAQQLGAGIIPIQNATTSSSVTKGESLKDTILTLESYSDIIVLRHPTSGSAKEAAEIAEIPIINAGDGTNEHPTQTLLDMYTIFEETGRLTNLTGVCAGDILNGRTVKSLIKGLSLFKGNTIYLLSPEKLQLPRNELLKLSTSGINLIEISTEKEIPKNADFWYWTRVQKERFKSLSEYKKIKNTLTLTPQLIEKYAGKNTIFMHPLPRVNEIDTAVDSDHRAVYIHKQMRNGVYIRMALLALIMGVKI
ncbi:MAG: aspartate carbamoyltransferase [Candidatus Levybacteria bacterium]|nr:aspartate carbamoyltransferase [Candidatus Levybacteria bacterium]MBP9814786.1 aspartate carbamoyltransferase [Candidatus Levybacteria bacterium]